MLLPSTLSAGPRPRLQRFGAYSHDNSYESTAPSPPTSTPQGIGGTCHALQSALGTRHAGTDSWSPRVRIANSSLHALARVVKRPPPKSKQSLKRRWDDTTDEEELSDVSQGSMQTRHRNRSQKSSKPAAKDVPSTPKRRRRCPPMVPFGLERKDFTDLDEGIDEAMSEEAMSTGVPTLDEGYGSMDIQVDLAGALLANSKPLTRLPLADSLFAPQQDTDAMSLSTPLSDLAAMALSPLTAHPDLPDLSPDLVDSDGSLPTAASSTCIHNNKLVCDMPPHQGGSAQPGGYFRSRSARITDEVLSDPVDYSTGSQPPGLNTDDRQTLGKPSPLLYEWSDADDLALVDIVVEKLRLKKCDWDECARLMGADNGASLGRRWKELVGDGCVGLKFRYSNVGFTAEDENRRWRGQIKRGRVGRRDLRGLQWT